MTRNGDIVTFKCDIRSDGKEYLNSSQRNNQIVWPSIEEYPNAQYRTTWANTCNVTSMIMGLEYAGWEFPEGKYEQPEDNLALFILTDEEIRKAYKAGQPAMYNIWINSFEGKASKNSQIYPPTEIHQYLSIGTNHWLQSTATSFSTNTNFIKALWKYLVEDNLPLVISTTFGGLGHIVTTVGVNYKISDYENGLEYRVKNPNLLPEIIPQSIIVDDPYGDCSDSNFEKYPSIIKSGNNIIVPWNVVVSKVKPINSSKVKWVHSFKHGMATI